MMRLLSFAALLALSACTGGGPSNSTDNDEMLERAKKIEADANAAVAKYETENAPAPSAPNATK